jgi:hypothetical protein
MSFDPDLWDRFVTDKVARFEGLTEENATMEAFVAERSKRFVLGRREPLLDEMLAPAQARPAATATSASRTLPTATSRPCLRTSASAQSSMSVGNHLFDHLKSHRKTNQNT